MSAAAERIYTEEAADALPILTYHSIDTSQSVVSVAPAVFAQQLRCLAELGVRGISLRQAMERRTRSGDWPDRCVVLTFDDGYANMHTEALPLLERYGFSATLFLISGHVGGRNDWSPPPGGLGSLPMLTWDQVGEMAAAGIEIGAHTRTHPNLATLSDDGVTAELRDGRLEIEARLGTAVESFAYPFGIATPAATRLAAHEFRSACTTALARARDEPSHSLPRVDVYYLRTRQMLTRLILGNLDTELTLRRWARSARRLWRADA